MKNDSEVLSNLIVQLLYYMNGLLMDCKIRTKQNDNISKTIYNTNILTLSTLFQLIEKHEQYISDTESKMLYDSTMSAIRPIVYEINFNLKQFIAEYPEIVNKMKNEIGVTDQYIQRFLRS